MLYHQLVMGWKFQNHELKQIPPPLNYLNEKSSASGHTVLERGPVCWCDALTNYLKLTYYVFSSFEKQT